MKPLNHIELKNIRKQYGEITALDSVNLALKSGKTTVLIGPSGCGKSTILRLIIGLLIPSSGEVFVKGEKVSPGTALKLRRRMGYVIQDGGLFPHLTAAQNVMLMARHLKKAPSEMEQKLEELCELTHFPKSGLNRYPVELSGGQRQRVSLMRALFLDPDVLLLDEPLGALDPMVRASLQNELKQIFQRLQKTVIIVTHDMAEAAFLGDRIVLLKDGKVIQQGSISDLRQQPEDPFVTEFINAQRSLIQL